jgi:thiamine-phosphate pyrophosphorylase
MRIIVISPESADARELASMEGFFGSGLERYHVRKPSWTLAELEGWLLRLPRTWRPRIVLHQHHGLVPKLGLGGAHEKDTGAPRGARYSRSCHDLRALRACLGSYATVIFGPVFPSITKRGYGPAPDFPWEELKEVLGSRNDASRTRVYAVGGVDGQGLGHCRDLGFDGAAVLGAVWNDSDPVRAFVSLHDKAQRLEAAPRAA